MWHFSVQATLKYLLILTLLVSSGINALESSVIYRVQALHQSLDDGIFFTPGIYPEYSTRQDVVLKAYHRGVTLEWSGSQLLQKSDSFNPESPQYKGVLNDGYWEFTLGDFDLTLGKKRISWGVGYAFRPLDILLQSRRLSIVTPLEEGLPLLAVERYTATGAWTLLCGESLDLRDPICAARIYGLFNDTEFQALIYSNEKDKFGFGSGFSMVSGEALEIHASFLYQRHYHQSMNRLIGGDRLLDTENPFEERELKDGLKVLVGGTISWASGFSLLLEAWHDDSGYSKREWRDLQQLTQAQYALRNSTLVPEAAIDINIKANNQFFAQTSMLEDNIFARLSYDGEKIDPSVGLLVSIADRGLALLVDVTTEISDHHRASFGLRVFGGDSQSAYRLMPVDDQLYLQWQGTFSF